MQPTGGSGASFDVLVCAEHLRQPDRPSAGRLMRAVGRRIE